MEQKIYEIFKGFPCGDIEKKITIKTQVRIFEFEKFVKNLRNQK